MRRTVYLAALAATLAFSTSTWCQQASQNQNQDQSQGQTSQTPPEQDSLAAAARRAREQKKDEPKATKVFTNDDLPSGAPISLVGSPTTPPPAAAAQTTPAKPSADSVEKMWRDKFAKLNHKLEQDQAELAILQRELGVLNTQYYGGDPVKGMQQGMTQTDISDKTAKIDAKTKVVDADQQAIADAGDELQKAGGDPGWER